MISKIKSLLNRKNRKLSALDVLIHAQQIVENILDILKIQTGRLDLAHKNIQLLSERIDRTEQLLVNIIELNDLDFTCHDCGENHVLEYECQAPKTETKAKPKKAVKKK